MVEGGVSAGVRVVQIAVVFRVVVIADDLPEVVDAARIGPNAGRGIVEAGVAAAVVKEAVLAGAVVVEPDDLARVVDAVGKGAIRDGGIVERGVSAARIKEAVAAAR